MTADCGKQTAIARGQQATRGHTRGGTGGGKALSQPLNQSPAQPRALLAPPQRHPHCCPARYPPPASRPGPPECDGCGGTQPHRPTPRTHPGPCPCPCPGEGRALPHGLAAMHGPPLRPRPRHPRHRCRSGPLQINSRDIWIGASSGSSGHTKGEWCGPGTIGGQALEVEGSNYKQTLSCT